MKVSNQSLAIAATAGAVLLATGDLMLIHALQPYKLGMAILYVICGIAAALAVYFCGIKRLLKAAPYLMAIEIVLLVLCLFSGFRLYGAARWVRFGSLFIAPAMLAMPMLCLFWAYIKKRSAEAISGKTQVIMTAAILLIPGLVFIEPFYSRTVLIAVMIVVLLALAGCSWKKLAIAAAAIVIAGALLAPTVLKSRPLVDQKEFYCNFYQPDYRTQFHTWSVITTLKNSVFFGHHKVSVNRKYYIPNAISDSALVAGCGEFGYAFFIAALLLIALITVSGTTITLRCQDPVDRLLAGGMTTAIALPALVNVLMMTGLIPIAGSEFPFLSYGASAMVANAAALACIVRIGTQKTSTESNEK